MHEHQLQSLKTAGTAIRPHIVLFVIDDLGYNDLGRFAAEEGGADFCTAPHLDGLCIKRSGIKLKQFYALPISISHMLAHKGSAYDWPLPLALRQTGTAEGLG